jgi:hypothetical protein
MYSISQVRTALNDPKWFCREALRVRSHSADGIDYYAAGVDIFEEDWDNLVILDAARYDEFTRVCTLDGQLQERRSRGATSSEFVRGNFRNRTAHDTVYVSANPHYLRLRGELQAEVHAYIGLHEGKYRNAADGITTHPGTVTEHARRAAREYANKRLIVHYLQPHQPYLGPSGETLTHGADILETIELNGLERRDVLRAYRENLELVADEVKDLKRDFQGKTVVTADHGELIGDRLPLFPFRDYGHHDGVHAPELIRIPWLVSRNGPRKAITAERPQRNVDRYEMSEVEDHLTRLGYLS